MWSRGAWCLILCSVVLAAQGPVVLLPTDEAANDAGFFTFRAQLQSAIARRDVTAVLDVVDPMIKNGFGDENGIEAFKEIWRIHEADSPLWKELGTALALGGVFDTPDMFTAPYTFSKWPSSFDSFEHVAVIGSNVRIRSAPGLEGAPIETVSHSILKLDLRAQAVEGWTAVELQDGRKGYIAAQFVRSPIDYRARFARSGNRWRLVFFLAGD